MLPLLPDDGIRSCVIMLTKQLVAFMIPDSGVVGRLG